MVSRHPAGRLARSAACLIRLANLNRHGNGESMWPPFDHYRVALGKGQPTERVSPWALYLRWGLPPVKFTSTGIPELGTLLVIAKLIGENRYHVPLEAGNESSGTSPKCATPLSGIKGFSGPISEAETRL